jgi:polyphosphate kinase
LKTHCKLSLVVRDEPGGLRRYVHFGTGNYNPKTARLYEDLGLLSCDPVLTADVGALFNHLSGYARTTRYDRLLVAPRSVRTGLIDRIRRELDHHRAGRPARVRLKVNALVDEAIIDELYLASQAGLPIDLWVRGICALKPGIPGLSSTIRVRSVVGRFLEHSRIFSFANGGDTEVWIGSADLMHRNLDRRVEVLVRVLQDDHVRQLSRLLDLAFDEGTSTWYLHGATWRRHHLDADGEPLLDLQTHLIEQRRR